MQLYVLTNWSRKGFNLDSCRFINLDIMYLGYYLLMVYWLPRHYDLVFPHFRMPPNLDLRISSALFATTLGKT